MYRPVHLSGTDGHTALIDQLQVDLNSPNEFQYKTKDVVLRGGHHVALKSYGTSHRCENLTLVLNLLRSCSTWYMPFQDFLDQVQAGDPLVSCDDTRWDFPHNSPAVDKLQCVRDVVSQFHRGNG